MRGHQACMKTAVRKVSLRVIRDFESSFLFASRFVFLSPLSGHALFGRYPVPMYTLTIHKINTFLFIYFQFLPFIFPISDSNRVRDSIAEHFLEELLPAFNKFYLGIFFHSL